VAREQNSLSKVIRGEAVSDCQAWHVPEVQSEGSQQRQPMTARQLEEIQNQAHREGFEQGLQEGRDTGVKEFTQRVQYLEQIIQSLSQPFEELDETIEQQLAQLAMLVARQLVRRELKTDPEQVIGVVREALSALPVTARNVQLALHPEDAVMVRESLSLQEGGQDHIVVEAGDGSGESLMAVGDAGGRGHRDGFDLVEGGRPGASEVGPRLQNGVGVQRWHLPALLDLGGHLPIGRAEGHTVADASINLIGGQQIAVDRGRAGSGVDTEPRHRVAHHDQHGVHGIDAFHHRPLGQLHVPMIPTGQ